MLNLIINLNHHCRRGLILLFAALTLVTAACTEGEPPVVAEAAIVEPVVTEPSVAAPEPVVESVQNEELESAPVMVHGFELSDLEGTMRSSDEWNGKPLLVNFWATWCVPCRKEMPALMELHEKYADQGFEVIGIAADELEKINVFLEKTPVSYPLLYGEMTSVFELSDSYGNTIGVLPHSAFVDRDGVVRHTKVGEITIEEAEELILDIL
ncbi:MAG: TlpA family protein disulfide reductase [Proteobacteria bacterium]|nr:TlpA family protein disulfide reductase [Pseudomonadota bacterium]